MEFWPRDDALHLAVEYNTDLFDAATIERMAVHLEVLLTALVADPDRPVSRLPLLTEAERRQVLQVWNDPDTVRRALAAAPGEIAGDTETVRGYVLDDHLRPVPPGVPGELYLAGVAWPGGTSDRPGLTAGGSWPTRSGRPAPGCTAPATWRAGPADGELEFLGRADNQVKVRGFRIELGEVEAALRAARDVAEAVAVVRRGRPAATRAAGRLRGAGARTRGAQPRRSCGRLLGQALPGYMVPSAFVALDRAAADRQRQASTGGALPGTGPRPDREHRVMSRRARRSRRCSPRSGPTCSA